MTRSAPGDTVYVKATNNVYTALAGIALLATILALVIVFLKANALFDKGLF